MRRFVSVLLALLLATALCAVPVGASGGEEGTGEILVKFKEKTTENEKAALNRNQNATKQKEIKALGVQVLKVKNPKAIAAIYKNNKHVEYAETNVEGTLELVPNDTNYKVRLAPIAKIINAEAGWDIITASDVPIAVIDSGAFAHSDLPALSAGYSPYDGTETTTDQNGHGTQVAGVIGALGNNGVGTTGINWGANIMPIKVAGTSSSVLVSNVAAALVYAADSGAKIINMSLGFSTGSQTLKNAVDYAHSKGCLLVAAAGNGGASSLYYPAAYDNVLSVGSTNNGTSRFSNSNYGAGQGVLAFSSYYTLSKSGSYTAVSGTSMAAPQVTGLASLVWKLAPNLTADQVAELICANAKDIGAAGYDNETGYGVIDMGATLKSAQKAAGAAPADSSSSSKPESVESLPDSSLPAEESSVPQEIVESTPPTAPAEPQLVTRRDKLNFSGNVGKKGGTANHALNAAADGDIDVSIGVGGKKNQVKARLLDASGAEVAGGSSSSAFSFKASGVAAGSYTLEITETSGANNVSYTAEVLMPEVTYEIINDEEVPLGTLAVQKEPNVALIIVISAAALAAVVVCILLVRRAKRKPGQSDKP